MEPFVVVGAGIVLILAASKVSPWIWRARQIGDHPVGGHQGADVVLHRDPTGPMLQVAAHGSRLTVRARQIGDAAPPIGDALFDAAVAVDGDNIERCAALDGPTRELLLTLIKRGGMVRDGMAQLRAGRAPATAADDTDVDLLLAVRASLSAALRNPMDRVEQLIRGDRRSGVQLAVYEVYLRVAGHEARAARLSRELIHRSHGALRLRAARFIHEPLSWQFIAVDPQEAPYVREAALRALVHAGTEEAADNAISAALAGPASLALAALEQLIGPPGARWATTLREMVREAWIDVDVCGGRFRNNPGLGIALMQAFAAHAAPQDEVELLEVAFREDNDLADIAWRAIARVGTTVSTHVIELRELPRHEGLLARTRRRRSADHVLHALRARELASARINREELCFGAVG